MRCTFLGCDAEPTHTLIPQYGRASVWCRSHGLARLHVEALFSNRQTEGPRLTPGDRLELPRPRAASLMRCCDGETYVLSYGQAAGSDDDMHEVKCCNCRTVLAVVHGPREEVYADL